MYDVIVIGAGPAGISAAIYAKRSNLKVLIINKGNSELQKAHKIENYYGFINGIEGKELYNNGIKQAKNLGIEIINDEVIDIEKEENIKIKTINNKYLSKTLIIATGTKKEKIDVKNIDNYLGKGISYCAVCDGYFFKNKNIGVIGNKEYAINEAKYLKNIAKNVVILTNGLDFNQEIEFEVNKKQILKILGEDIVTGIEFTDKTKLALDGIFIAIGNAGGIDFSRKLGIILEDNKIKVNKNMETNIEGIYACGDVTGGLLQINKSVYEGAIAAISCMNYLKNLYNKIEKETQL